jgi:hypothetical protein
MKAARVTLWECLQPGRKGGEFLEEPILQTHLSGVSYNQSRWEHCRWYDKGIESGNESFHNVIRHEEEIKQGYAGRVAVVIGGRVRCNREFARDRMNERYAGWGTTDVYDLGVMLAEHGKTGAAAVGLVLHPEYETLYKQHLSRAIFYRVKAVAMEARKLRVPVNLRLPEDAWLEQQGERPVPKSTDAGNLAALEAQQKLQAASDWLSGVKSVNGNIVSDNSDVSDGR